VAAELAAAGSPSDEVVESDDRLSPYVGLESFQIEDSDRFFGRESVTSGLFARLVERRFVALFGASGEGKSSLLRAGLVPKVRAETSWRSVVFTPGASPVEGCAVHLASLIGVSASELTAELMADPRNLRRLVRQAFVDQPGDVEVLLVVDQFEEVFTLCEDASERAEFIAMLLAAAGDDTSRTRVVLGVRADVYPRCAEHPDLSKALEDSQMLLGAMTTEELRQAVTRPAVQAGLTVETALSTELVAEAAGRIGVLALVSHAMLQTWRRRRGNALTVNGYRAAGGLQSALARSAEAVYAGFTVEQQTLTRQLFGRLTVVGDGPEHTRRRISRDELRGVGADLDTVLRALASARLLTLGQNTVEITHETLFRAWPRLRDWLAEDRDGVRVHRLLSEAAGLWEELDRDPGALHRGTRLALTTEWVKRAEPVLSDREREFLDHSTASQTQQRRAALRRMRVLRFLVIGLALLLVAATGGIWVALAQRREAVSQSRIALSRQLATQALALVDSEPGTAMLLAVEAFRTAPTAEARGALSSMSARSAYRTEFTAHAGAVSEVAFAPDGRTLVTVGRDQTAVVWDPVRRTRLAILTGHDTWLRAMAISPDGQLLATGGDDTDVVLWNLADRGKLAVLSGHTGRIKEIAFSPDGRTLATSSADGTARLWDVPTRDPRIVLTGHTAAVNSVAFSPDGQTVATASADSTVRLWNATTGLRLGELTGHKDSVNAVAFSPDGHTLATASTDDTAGLWDTATRVRLATLTGHASTVTAVTFSPDGRTLATASIDKTVALWDTQHRTIRARLTGHTGNIYTLAFSSQAPLLASASEDGTVVLWDTNRAPLAGYLDQGVNAIAFSPDGSTIAVASGGHVVLWNSHERTPDQVLTARTGAKINAITFSPNGRTLAAATESAQPPADPTHNTATLWDLTNRAPPRELHGHTDRVLTVAFSPDGRTLATSSVDRTAILWDTSQGTRIATFTGHTDAINGLAFSPDGHTLATAAHDRTAILWDTERRTPRATLIGHTGWIRSVAFSPSGQALATASTDQTVKVWDATTGTLQTTYTGHTDALVNGFAFSPDTDTDTIAISSGEHTTTLWSLTNHTKLASLTGHTRPITSMAYSPDGHTLATASDDHTVLLWDTNPQDTQNHICTTINRNLTSDEWHEYLPETPYHHTCDT
jgi:WD40 repeat protein